MLLRFTSRSKPRPTSGAPGTFFSLSLLVSVFLQSTLFAQIDRVASHSFATRAEVIAQNGMVATSHPLAAQVGLEILQSGGNAVDAAIATNAALGLMEPTGCGIGGDLFAIVWDAGDKQLHGLNASGRSPQGLSYENLREELARLGKESIPSLGVLPISVPGAVDGWFQLHDQFGTKPMPELLAPAIHYAENGFPLTELIAHYWQYATRYQDLPGSAYETWVPGGKPPQKGQLFRNPDLAETYRRIAEGGREEFYQGSIADEIDAFMKQHGGYLRKADLAAHSSTWIKPVSINYRGYDVYELPPNGQGIAALQMLTILEGFDLRAMGRNSPEALHVMIEAKKLAFEDRAKFYGDPDFSDIPLEGLLSEEYAAQRRSLIDPERAARRVVAGHPALQDGDTIYLTTADSEGNMVSLIQSNYRGMGSGVMVPGLGFGFQNRGEMFVLEPRDHANAYEPNKRPFHTIIPAFVMKDGEPWLSFGLMGGAMQPQGHVQILTNLIDFDLNLQEAGDAARWQHHGSTDYNRKQMVDGGFVSLESGFPFEALRGLERRGHDLRTRTGSYGGYQAIQWDAENGVYLGASESRKDGHAVGY
ncbi:MAG: gamma-glutamyltransferase [Verrucomicrobiota bacterium JB023]|nr:gamma-glutamyltransferase [Verrucomicrobiota bacterium JB023]